MLKLIRLYRKKVDFPKIKPKKMKKILNIFYTSDIHGRILSQHDILDKSIPVGLSRLSTFFAQQNVPFLYLDNGDILQGAAVMDQSRDDLVNPAALALNKLGCEFYTLGNHDFNYGLPYLFEYIKQMNGVLLLANVFQNNQPLGMPFTVVEREGIRIGLIGVTTAYIPHWELPEHIQGLKFVSAEKAVRELLPSLREKVDVVAVLYHGGIEQDLTTSEPIGRQTIENEGVAISNIDGVDIVLSGHQHMLVSSSKILQPGVEGTHIGMVTITKTEEEITISPSLIQNDSVVDETFEAMFSTLQQKTIQWLDQHVGYTDQDFRANDPLSLRAKPHPLVSWIHQLQFAQTNADISVVSLPNDVRGFQKDISNRDLLNAFVYPNTLFEVAMTGAQIKKAMEQSAAYFSLEEGQVVVSSSFLQPKVEHYNYDMYAGIEYKIDLTKPVGERIRDVMFHQQPLLDQTIYRVVLNNYRANGGGDYEMFQQATVIQEHDVTLLQLSERALKASPSLHIDITPTFVLVTEEAGPPSQ